MQPIVIYSSYEEQSRNFLSQVPEGIESYDWYNSDRSSYTGPGPSQFPVVCMSVVASGVVSDNMVGLFSPTDWDSVLTAQAGIDTGFGLDNQSMLTNVIKLGTYSAGQYVGNLPNIAGFESAIFQHPTLSASAKLSIPLRYNLIERYIGQVELLQGYWQIWCLQALGIPGVKDPDPAYAWLDVETITIIEGLAVQFNIPLVGQ